MPYTGIQLQRKQDRYDGHGGLCEYPDHMVLEINSYNSPYCCVVFRPKPGGDVLTVYSRWDWVNLPGRFWTGEMTEDVLVHFTEWETKKTDKRMEQQRQAAIKSAIEDCV